MIFGEKLNQQREGAGLMLSNPYPTKGTAKSGAKDHAEENKLTKFMLMVDLEKRQYHFSDDKINPEPKMIVFAKYEFKKGKWLEKPLSKAARKGA